MTRNQSRSRGVRRSFLLAASVLCCISGLGRSFLVRPGRLPAPVVNRRWGCRHRGVLRLTITPEDKDKINNDFELLLNDVKKPPSQIIEFLTRYRQDVDLDWDKATLLLDRVSDSRPFKRAVEERLATEGRRAQTDDEFAMATTGQSFMYLEEYQREQFEAVSYVYALLKERRLLRAFSCIQDAKGYAESFLSKNVSPEEIEARSQLPMTALAPGQGQNLWIYAGAFLCVLELLICNFYGVDAGAVIPVTILSFLGDRLFLGGVIFDQVARVLFPRYKERIIRHEAGHFLLAYLLGCPVQNCILRPVFNGAVLGEAGTIFLDKKLFDELERNRISASSVDRYTTIVMAGIAAEALTFNTAEGGSSDEQSILLLLSLMNPPWDFTRIANQARWAALRALLVLKDYSKAYEALVEALMRGDSVGACVQVIEDALKDATPIVPAAALSPTPASSGRSASAEFDDLQRVIMPLGGSSSISSPDGQGRPASEVEVVVKPNFEAGGVDAIQLQEEKEKQAAVEEEKKYKAKMRELELRLKLVNARLAGKPEEEAVKELDSEDPEEGGIDSQLSAVERRMKELQDMLR